ncbi:MAG: triose-phosphate isomerase [Candidatus Marsarchaeota archaeon]|nr:triose-phosphate isomerase [Candidatus Marsarchaeota archaeon]
MRDTVIINYKTYPSVAGKEGLRLAIEATSVSREFGIELVVAPNLVDTSLFCQAGGLTVFAQHCDLGNRGNMTGRVTLDSLRTVGAEGLLVNHSEYPQTDSEIEELVMQARQMGLKTCVCVPDSSKLEAYARLCPDYLAVEPPELIGGDVSVSKARPGLLKEAFKAIRSSSKTTAPLCGAGIKTAEDVSVAKKLGGSGVLIASGFVLSDDPISQLANLISGFSG